MKELQELEGHDLQTSVGESRMCNQAQQEKGFRALAWTLWTYGSAQHNDSRKVEWPYSSKQPQIENRQICVADVANKFAVRNY